MVEPAELYPNLVDVETALVTALMYDRYKWDEHPAVFSLFPGDFIWDRRRWVFETICKLHDLGQSCNFLTVALHLHRDEPGRYKAMKGDTWFREACMGFADHAMTFLHIEQWARDIKEAAIERGVRPKERSGVNVGKRIA